MIQNITVWIFLIFTIERIFSSDPHYCLSELQNLVEKAESQFSDWRVGVHAIGRTDASKEFSEIIAFGDENLYLPASNTKVMTTTSTLVELGKDFFFTTNLYSSKNDSTCLKLMGDPSMNYENVQDIAEFILSNKRNKSLLVDFDSYFGKSILECPATWELDDLPFYYSALPTTSILNVNHDIGVITAGEIGKPVNIKTTISPIPIEFDVSNTVTIPGENFSVSMRMVFSNPAKIIAFGEMGVSAKPRTQEISIPLPDEHFLNTFRFFLKNKVKVEEGTCDEEGEEMLYSVKSDILLNLLNYTLQVSDNTYAELFLRQLGARHRPTTPFSDAFTSGLEYVQSHYLNSLFGVDKSLFRMNDGSGMSRQTFLSPKSLTTVLEYMFQNYPIYKYILPISGSSGTLKNRFLDYKGMIHAKTGTLTGVGALSGYISPKYYKDDIIFSIIINNSLLSATDVRKTIDQIALYLAFTDPSC